MHFVFTHVLNVNKVLFKMVFWMGSLKYDDDDDDDDDDDNDDDDDISK